MSRVSFIDDSTTIMDIEGQSIRVYEAGTGVPVVVLHGWGGRIESMAPVLTCLRTGFRVIAPDLPGFGGSPIPEAVWGTPDYARLVSDLMSKAGVEKAHFVGHSYGAKTALYLAATEPALIDKLVLAGSSGLRTPPSFKVRMKRGVSKAARFAGRFGSPGDKVRSAIYRRIASKDYTDAGPLRSILVKVVNEDLKDMLPNVAQPTLLVWGSEDDAAPLSHGRVMEKLIPDAGLVVFEGRGHFAYLDEADRFCTVVRHFLGPA
jgi:pimeloyl-ACP methyl ester carboxylesterase